MTKKSMKPNFYLRSLEKINPAQWYSTQLFGLDKIKQTVKEILKSVELDGYFANHSLRCTGITRLFYTGLDQQLVREYSWYHSDTSGQYQIPSKHQKKMISEALAGFQPKQIEISDVQNEI